MKNNLAPWHFGMRYAGQTLDWLPTDTKENYDRMTQDLAHCEYFAQKGWDQPGAITYRINSNGFRSKEFVPGTCLLALGCSYSMGIGLPESAIWPTLVGNSLSLDVYNLSWPGASADTCFMLAQYWIPVLQPRLVVFTAPPQHRLDLLDDHEHTTYMPGQELSQNEFIQKWFTVDRNAELNNARNKYAIRGLCVEHNVPCMTYNAHEYFARSREEVEYARDYMHAGPLGHKMFAERILDDWRKKYA
jgi:hypothetical protein